MKAIVQYQYGSPDVLRLAEIPKPSPEAGEVLVKVHAASVNAADWRMMRANPFFIRFMFGLRTPKIRTLGADVAGRVEAVGPDVTGFRTGDEVFGDLSSAGFGGFSEYVCAPAELVLKKPSNMSFEEAAAVPMAAVTALQGLRDKGGIQSGERVLIHGASGGVGMFAVQLAKAYGAEVTAVCSTRAVEVVSSLGAQRVLDYTREDPLSGGARYDLILDNALFRSPTDYLRVLNAGGKYVMVGGSIWRMFQVSLLEKRNTSIELLSAKSNPRDLEHLREVAEAGKVKAVIDRTYLLSDVPDAIRYVEEAHPVGKVVISIA